MAIFNCYVSSPEGISCYVWLRICMYMTVHVARRSALKLKVYHGLPPLPHPLMSAAVSHAACHSMHNSHLMARILNSPNDPNVCVCVLRINWNGQAKERTKNIIIIEQILHSGIQRFCGPSTEQCRVDVHLFVWMLGFKWSMTWHDLATSHSTISGWSQLTWGCKIRGCVS